jgi:hypothetical protein
MAQALVPDDGSFVRGNAGRLADVPIPKHQIPDGGTLPDAVNWIIHDNTIARFIPNTIGEGLTTTIFSIGTFAEALPPFVGGQLTRPPLDHGLETAGAV